MPTPQRQDKRVRRTTKVKRTAAPQGTGLLDGTTSSLGTVRKKRVRARTSSKAVGFKSAAGTVGKHGRRNPSHARKEKRGFPVWGVILIAVLVVGLGVGGIFAVRHFLPADKGGTVAEGQQVTVVIPEGSTGSDIVTILRDAGVIRSGEAFRSAVKAQNADQSLRSGTYSFVTGADPADVVRQLVNGPNSSEGQLKLPEGLTMYQTAELVESSLGIPSDDFLAQAKASNYVEEYPFLSNAGNDSLEGYLYPKTYDLAGKEATADTVIRLMLSQYETEVEKLDLQAACDAITSRYGLTPTDYDLLKVASVVEKELGGNHEDGYKVSSVIYNRLSNGMALQSDATMMYVTGGTVTAEDLNTDSPYNTYLYKGLPPTPICSPSAESIKQAMEPADTGYYYFLLIGDHHVFSETYEDHEAAIASYQASQGEAGAASEED